jgi:hypothetical protein
MEAGEKELRKAFEDVTTRNVKAAVEYSNETRKLVNDLVTKVDHLEKALIDKDKVINGLRMQIASIQQKLYTGGS